MRVDLTVEQIENLFLESKNKTDLINKLNIPTNQNAIWIDNALLKYLSQIGFTDRQSISKINFNIEKTKRLEKRYLQNPKFCPNCGKIIPFKIKDNKYCSQSCAATSTNKIRGPLSSETKQKIGKGLIRSLNEGKFVPWNRGLKLSNKISNLTPKQVEINNLPKYKIDRYSKFLNDETRLSYKVKQLNGELENEIYVSLKFCLENQLILNDDKYDISNIDLINSIGFCEKTCPICGRKFYGRFWKDNKISKGNCCSNKCKTKLSSMRAVESVQRQIQNGTFVGWKPRTNRSYPEKFWINVLNNNNIQFISEYPIERQGTQNYYLDFYIEKNDKRIDLEIDGKQHKYKDISEKDKIRDEYLTNLGFIVYRIEWNKMDGSEEKSLITKNKIDKFIEFYNSL